MCKSGINLEIKLGEVEYIDNNIVFIPVYLRQKGTEKYNSRSDKFVKFDGQVWQIVNDKDELHMCMQKLLEHEKQKLYEYYDSEIMTLDESLEIQKIKIDKQNCLDYYDEQIAELKEELKRLNKPVIYNNTEFKLSDLGIEALDIIDDLQIDIEEGNNITGDLDCLIKSLIKWKKEMDTKLVSQLRDELVMD